MVKFLMIYLHLLTSFWISANIQSADFPFSFDQIIEIKVGNFEIIFRWWFNYRSRHFDVLFLTATGYDCIIKSRRFAISGF